MLLAALSNRRAAMGIRNFHARFMKTSKTQRFAAGVSRKRIGKFFPMRFVEGLIMCREDPVMLQNVALNLLSFNDLEFYESGRIQTARRSNSKKPAAL
jgi:hypothetical protein